MNKYTFSMLNKITEYLQFEELFDFNTFSFCISLTLQNNGAQQLASEATVYIMLEDVNDEIPLFTEREQETVLEGEPIGTKVTQVNAIDKDGTFPNNQVSWMQQRQQLSEGSKLCDKRGKKGER